MTIHGDNDESVMAKNPHFHKRSKHIMLRWHWVRELLQGNIIKHGYLSRS